MQIPGGYKVLDASDQALAYVYALETQAEADIAKVPTFDKARRIAVNVAKLSDPLRQRKLFWRSPSRSEIAKANAAIKANAVTSRQYANRRTWVATPRPPVDSDERPSPQ